MALKPVPKDNKGLKKLPTKVRNKMGFMKKGGKVAGPKKYSKKPTKEVQSDAYKPLPSKLSKKDLSDVLSQRTTKVLKKNKGGLVKGGTSSQMTGKRYKGTF
jgi:hypothetical protein